MSRKRADIRVEDHGSIVLLRPLTTAGEDWLNERISDEGFQPYRPVVIAEPRYVAAIVEGAIEDGLKVA